MDPNTPTPACATAPPLQNGGVRWRLTRPCALAPDQLLLSYAALAVFSAAIALPFGWHGLWLIPLWCLLEISAAGAMYLFYMAHATDGEQITLDADGPLAIEVMRGLRVRHYRMNPAWAHLERGGVDKERLWLCCGLLRVEVASQLPGKERRRVERELRRALAERQAGTGLDARA